MALNRNIAAAITGFALISAGTTAFAAAPEPLVVTRLADPDPNYAPPAEPRRRSGRGPVATDAGARIDEAMEDFGRVLGQASMIEQQRIQERCKAGEPDNETPEQRFAWAASCRYSRH